MKKLTLVMLAVISMALISCGGGKNETKEGAKEETKVAKVYEPATPAIMYKATDDRENVFKNELSVRDCFEVKKVALAKADLYEVAVTVTLEALKDRPVNSYIDYADYACSDPVKTVEGTIVLFDENMVEIKPANSPGWGDNGYASFNNWEKQGDVCMMSAEIEYGDIASRILERAKYVQIKDMVGDIH